MHEGKKIYLLMGEHERCRLPSTPPEFFRGKSFLVIISVGFSLATSFTHCIFSGITSKTIHETTWVAHDLVLWPVFWN